MDPLTTGYWTKLSGYYSTVHETDLFSNLGQAYHKDLLDNMPPPVAPVIRHPPHPPPLHRDSSAGRSSGKNSRRGRDRRSGSRQHRKAAAGNREKQAFL